MIIRFIRLLFQDVQDKNHRYIFPYKFYYFSPFSLCVVQFILTEFTHFDPFFDVYMHNDPGVIIISLGYLIIWFMIAVVGW